MNHCPCPLCGETHSTPSFTRSSGVSYLKCSRCALIYLEPGFRLDLESEKAQYDLHQNDIHDERYQKFMEPLITELLSHYPGPRGLDFGSGPTSVLRHLLAPKGFHITLYDKFYFQDPGALDETYDFIFASEVVEHMEEPLVGFQLFHRLLRGGGVLILGTSLYDGVADLSRWSYAMDPTHISLFSQDTMRWLAQKTGFDEPHFFSRRGILLRKCTK